MKVAENSPQNARNCTIFKNFLGGACPQTPLTKCLPISWITRSPSNNYELDSPIRQRFTIRGLRHHLLHNID